MKWHVLARSAEGDWNIVLNVEEKIKTTEFVGIENTTKLSGVYVTACFLHGSNLTFAMNEPCIEIQIHIQNSWISYVNNSVIFGFSWLRRRDRWHWLDGHTDLCDWPTSNESYSSTSSPSESGIVS